MIPKIRYKIKIKLKKRKWDAFALKSKDGMN